MSGDIPIVAPGDVTPAWLTEVLRHAGRNVTVKDMQAKQVGTGQVGDTFRFTLTYDGAHEGAPETIVGKFPAADEASRATGVGLGNYVREVRFYQQLADTALITTPTCLYTEVDPATSDFVLMMEDLSPAEQGDQLKGLTLEQARLAVDEAAKLHASHWGRDELDQIDWLMDTSAAPKPMTPELVTALWDGFRDRYKEDVPQEYFRIGDDIVRTFGDESYAYTGPKCLTHSDFRPDNMMFGTADGGYPLAVVDWQSVGYSCGLADLSYMLSGSLPREVLRANETELLQRYHDKLVELGVNGFSLDDAWENYRRFAFGMFTMAFIASMIVERTDRGDKMFLAMLKSGADHVMDLNATEFLAA